MNVHMNIPLAPYTTFRIGGPAEYFVEVHTQAELASACAYASERRLPVTVLGGGSNVLVADEGVKGLVIKMNIGGVAYEEDGNGVRIAAGAGVAFDELVEGAVARGLWGIENLSGIPGTFGGAVVQNVNAYGVTLADVIADVSVFDIERRALRTFSRDECQFAYRTSFFKRARNGSRYVVLRAALRLSKDARVQSAYKSASQSMEAYFKKRGIAEPSPRDVRGAIRAVREKIGMLEGQYRSAGSFFTNVILPKDAFSELEALIVERYPENARRFSPWHWPLPDGSEKVSAAFLMECTEFNKTAYGAKATVGAVALSPVHTLSLINANGATASDVRAFAANIEKKIKETFGVQFESEVCFL